MPNFETLSFVNNTDEENLSRTYKETTSAMVQNDVNKKRRINYFYLGQLGKYYSFFPTHILDDTSS